MSHRIAVGLDGSDASVAAAVWAAQEAELRHAALELVHADDWPENAPFAAPLPESRRLWAEDLLERTREQLLGDHPALDIGTHRIDGLALGDALASAAADADVLVLGSRALGSVAGFLVGSVSSATIPVTDTPVVLVRPAADRPAGHTGGSGPVVLGVDLRSNCDRLFAFACEEADRRGSPLVVVHAWTPPPVFSYAPMLDPGVQQEIVNGLGATLRDMLGPWKEKYARLSVDARIAIGQPAIQILDAAGGAALVVVGRRIRRAALGGHVGALTHAVMHHATSPVAVVAHD